jgi:hypothetical protein
MRVTGKHAAIYLGGVKVADAFDVALNVAPAFEETSAFGDIFDKPVPVGGKWSGSAKRYHTTGATTFLSMAAATPASALPLRLILYRVFGDLTTRVFEGDCWIESADGTYSKGPVQESANILGYGDPVYVG